jgi:hypothetical protein
MAGIGAFKEAFMSAGSIASEADDFLDYDNRVTRYEIYWAWYESTVYRDIHTWAKGLRQTQALYKYVRNIYNPSYRLGEFWKSHLWGGALDPAAGDGDRVPSALPIEVPAANSGNEEALRRAIARLWEWSRWGVNKDIVTLRGAIFGDAALRVVDDTEKQKVYLERVHPGTISEVELDAFGSVKSYEITEERVDPLNDKRTVTYTETAERAGVNVIYRTYRNKDLYAWNGVEAEWAVPYGFIPVVLIQHNNIGLDWGWSEIHPMRSKIQELDDIASALGDQIRKSVNVHWMFAGVSVPKSGDTAPAAGGASSSTSRPEPGREEIKAFYAPAGALAQPLVVPLDITAVAAHLHSILEELERDYPELQMDIWNAGGDQSGRALRIARQRVEIKAQQRRANYDDALRRAQQMAIAIGGWRDLPDFAPFNLDSYAAGNLDHSIGDRPVFRTDPMDDLEEDQLFWQVAESAIRAGVPLPVYLAQQGWAEDDITAVVESDEYQRRQMMANMGLAALSGADEG